MPSTTTRYSTSTPGRCSWATPSACCCPIIGVLRPATPPPEFDLEQAVHSLRRFAELRPERMVLTHYGPVADAQATLAEAEAMLRGWVEVAERVIEDAADAGIDDVAAALAAAFALDPRPCRRVCARRPRCSTGCTAMRPASFAI